MFKLYKPFNELIKCLDLRNSILLALNICIYQQKNSLHNKENIEGIMRILLNVKDSKDCIDKITPIISEIKNTELAGNIKTAIEKTKDNFIIINNRNYKNQRSGIVKEKDSKGYCKIFKKPGGISSEGIVVFKKIEPRDIKKNKESYSELENSKFFNLHMIKYCKVMEVYHTKIGAELQNISKIYKNNLIHDDLSEVGSSIRDSILRINQKGQFLITKFIPNILKVSEDFDKLSIENIDKKSLVKTFLSFIITGNADFGCVGDDFYLNNKENIIFGIDFGAVESSCKFGSFEDSRKKLINLLKENKISECKKILFSFLNERFILVIQSNLQSMANRQYSNFLNIMCYGSIDPDCFEPPLDADEKEYLKNNNNEVPFLDLELFKGNKELLSKHKNKKVNAIKDENSELLEKFRKRQVNEIKKIEDVQARLEGMNKFFPKFFSLINELPDEEFSETIKEMTSGIELIKAVKNSARSNNINIEYFSDLRVISNSINNSYFVWPIYAFFEVVYDLLSKYLIQPIKNLSDCIINPMQELFYC